MIDFERISQIYNVKQVRSVRAIEPGHEQTDSSKEQHESYKTTNFPQIVEQQDKDSSSKELEIITNNEAHFSSCNVDGQSQEIADNLVITPKQNLLGDDQKVNQAAPTNVQQYQGNDSITSLNVCDQAQKPLAGGDDFTQCKLVATPAKHPLRASRSLSPNRLRWKSYKNPPLSSLCQKGEIALAIGKWQEYYKDWKEERNIPQACKIFIIMGGYNGIRQALLDRGWHENLQTDSDFYDLKWTTKTKSIGFGRLLTPQATNHFSNSYEYLTTKCGLTRSLKQSKFFVDQDDHTFYPRCYILSDKQDYQQFEVDFKLCGCVSVLQRFLDQGTQAGTNVPLPTVILAIHICNYNAKYQRHLVHEDSDESVHNQLPLISKQEWGIISECPIFNTPERKAVAADNKARYNMLLTKLLNQDNTLTKLLNQYELSPVDTKLHVDDQWEQRIPGSVCDALFDEARRALSTHKDLSKQHYIDGLNNLWILKPGGKSRGRGIQCFNSLSKLNQLLQKIKDNQEQLQMWVVQKYIERPLIIHNRKSDIRQWVIVSSWNPLVCWFYKDAYARFCAEDFNVSAVDNVYCHLTNNNIAVKSKLFESQCIGEQNMWHSDTLKQWLIHKYGKDVWTDQIQKQMKQIVLWTLLPIQDDIKSRENSFELYGYDFAIDENLNVWLLEVNCSPSLEPSTQITQQLVAELSEDIVKVVIDFPLHKRDVLLAALTKQQHSDSQERSLTVEQRGQPIFSANYTIEEENQQTAINRQNSNCLDSLGQYNTGKFELIYVGQRMYAGHKSDLLSQPLILNGKCIYKPQKSKQLAQQKSVIRNTSTQQYIQSIKQHNSSKLEKNRDYIQVRTASQIKRQTNKVYQSQGTWFMADEDQLNGQVDQQTSDRQWVGAKLKRQATAPQLSHNSVRPLKPYLDRFPKIKGNSSALRLNYEQIKAQHPGKITRTDLLRCWNSCLGVQTLKKEQNISHKNA